MKQNSKSLLVLLILSILFSCARTPQQLSKKPVVLSVDLTSEKIRHSIVRIESENTSGTGFFVAPDKIATSVHVVAHAGPIFVTSPDKSKNWTIEGVVAYDARNKLVVLKITGEGTPLPLKNSDTLEIGASISILGYPDGEYKVTDSSIQSIRKNNKWLRIKTTTSKKTNGSPVLNNNGQVIGVIVPYGRSAIPSDALAALLNASMPMEPLSEWQQRKPVRAAASYSLGIEKSDAKDYAGAVVNFDKAIELNPEYVYAYYERGRAQFYLGDHDSAIASCTQILEIDPHEADAYYGRGTIKASLGNYAEAIVDLDKAIELDAQRANAYSNRGAVKFELGESEDTRGNAEAAQRLYEAAMADLDKAIQIDPEDADAYNNRGAAKLALDDFEGAILDFSRAIQIDSEHAKAYNNRGWAKFRLGEAETKRGNAKKARSLYKAAIADLDKAIQINPEHPDVYSNRGRVKFRLGEAEVARAKAKEAQRLYQAVIADSDKAIQINPKNIDAYNNRGAARFRLGASASARGELEKTQGLYKAAIEDYTRAIHINPENADTYYKRGLVKCKLGDIKSNRTYAAPLQAGFKTPPAVGDVKIVQRLYHEGITDLDKYIYLTRPDNLNEPVADTEFEEAINSIVRVVGWDNNFYFGSGFFVEKDKIATNIHVVSQTGPVFVTLGSEETIWKVEEVTAFDAENDLVVLKISDKGIPLSLGDSNALQSGESAVAMGYPGGGYKTTTGVIDSIQNSGKVVRMKVVTSGGNSGGPTLNSKGQVIGINVRKNERYTYAIPSNVLRALIVESGSSESLVKWRKRDQIRAYTYLIQGQEKYKSSRYPEALSHFNISIQLNPALRGTHTWRGNTNFKLDNHEEAIVDYNTAIQLNPDNAEAYIQRGAAKMVLGDFEKAIVDLDKAIQISSEHAEAYYLRGQAKKALGQKEAAKADFERAKALDPNVGQ